MPSKLTAYVRRPKEKLACYLNQLVDNRVKSLEQKIDSRLQELDQRFDGWEQQRSHVEERVRYLLNEVSDIRISVRELIGSKRSLEADQRQTKDSFSYQWKHISEGSDLLGDAEFERKMYDLLQTYTELPLDWFSGKKILDAGCGMGRWSVAMAKIGAHVTAIDQSFSGIEQLSKIGSEFDNFRAERHDLLEPLPFGPSFDLVWCYGVTHHTGNTKLATHHVADMVKAGGRLFLMIYGEPEKPGAFQEINSYVELRRVTRHLSLDDRLEYIFKCFPEEHVHGYFDAISPDINDLHRFDEVSGWLHDWGFVDVRRTFENRNIHLVADRPPQKLQ